MAGDPVSRPPDGGSGVPMIIDPGVLSNAQRVRVEALAAAVKYCAKRYSVKSGPLASSAYAVLNAAKDFEKYIGGDDETN